MDHYKDLIANIREALTEISTTGILTRNFYKIKPICLVYLPTYYYVQLPVVRKITVSRKIVIVLVERLPLLTSRKRLQIL